MLQAARQSHQSLPGRFSFAPVMLAVSKKSLADDILPKCPVP
jgi:hypothetical protein